jgi:hypothetical protein
MGYRVVLHKTAGFKTEEIEMLTMKVGWEEVYPYYVEYEKGDEIEIDITQEEYAEYLKAEELVKHVQDKMWQAWFRQREQAMLRKAINGR